MVHSGGLLQVRNGHGDRGALLLGRIPGRLGQFDHTQAADGRRLNLLLAADRGDEAANIIGDILVKMT